jgi:hypothetical protein
MLQLNPVAIFILDSSGPSANPHRASTQPFYFGAGSQQPIEQSLLHSLMALNQSAGGKDRNRRRYRQQKDQAQSKILIPMTSSGPVKDNRSEKDWTCQRDQEQVPNYSTRARLNERSKKSPLADAEIRSRPQAAKSKSPNRATCPSMAAWYSRLALVALSVAR